MAIDTAFKRASAINLGCPWRAVLPVPSGTVDQAARQAAALLYSGILAFATPVYDASVTIGVYGGELQVTQYGADVAVTSFGGNVTIHEV